MISYLKLLSTAVFTLLLISGCRNSGKLNKEKFIKLKAELALARQAYEKNDMMYRYYRGEILDSAGVTEKEYASFTDKNLKSPRKFGKINNEVAELLEQKINLREEETRNFKKRSLSRP